MICWSKGCENEATNGQKCRACNTKFIRKYAQTEKGKQALARANRRRYLKDKDKIASRLKLREAVKRGEVVKPMICEVCKETKPLQGHHEDYDKPLEVNWVCVGCHADLDRERERRLKTAPNTLKEQ